MSALVIDVEARAPVWLALSDLYLDTSYRDSVRRAAHDLAGSPYTSDQLRAILFDEVHPVVAANLCAPVGVWDRFDQAWLAQVILRNRRRPRWARPRGRCQLRYAILLWRLLAPRIAGLRAATRPPRSYYDFFPGK